jgi:cardiolipin synthase A/B
MHVRTSQGTIAWVIWRWCHAVPGDPAVLAVRAHAVFRLCARRTARGPALRELARRCMSGCAFAIDIPRTTPSSGPRLLGGLPFTRGNELELLIDGEETFERLFRHRGHRRNYLCVCFFIVKNDVSAGASSRPSSSGPGPGVKVYFLFDEIGSHKLPRRYLRELREAGRGVPLLRHQPPLVVAPATEFPQSPQDRGQRWQGGVDRRLNVGDEYLGRICGSAHGGTPTCRSRGRWCRRCRWCFWRTGSGPANQVPELRWANHPERPIRWRRSFPPVRPIRRIRGSWWWRRRRIRRAETVDCLAVFRAGRGRAHRAAGRRDPRGGCAHPDSRAGGPPLVWLSAFSYYEQSIPYGMRIFRYHRGFLHQKVMLIDDGWPRWARRISTTARSG